MHEKDRLSYFLICMLGFKMGVIGLQAGETVGRDHEREGEQNTHLHGDQEKGGRRREATETRWVCFDK